MKNQTKQAFIAAIVGMILILTSSLHILALPNGNLVDILDSKLFWAGWAIVHFSGVVLGIAFLISWVKDLKRRQK
ncbi:hypothetical protein GCM10011318_00040 [Phaeocystidibacter marisrubri]|nr:hypothetical protein GCM10011318_00040 [Phaeocystidibacter marisrubri]